MPLQLSRLFFAPDEAPDFVALNVGHGNVFHDPSEEPLALLADFDHRGDDRIPVDFGKPLGTPNAVPFQQHSQAEYGLLGGKSAAIRGPGRIVGKSSGAGIAAVSLGTVAVRAESTGRTLAHGTKHGETPSIAGAVRVECAC